MEREKSYIQECNENGYILLGQAIIVQAVRDYKKNLAIIRKHPFDEEAGKEITRIEKFFHSGLYGAITTIDPDKLIKELREE